MPQAKAISIDWIEHSQPDSQMKKANVMITNNASIWNVKGNSNCQNDLQFYVLYTLVHCMKRTFQVRCFALMRP